MNYYTADTHWGHNAIIRYCNRPFADVDEMNQALIDGINDTVNEGDKLTHLGDFSFGPKHSPKIQIENAVKFRKAIKCKSILLIRGNHDYLINIPEFRALFTNIIDGLTEIVDRDVKEHITLCHYALRVWNASHHGRWHLYAHSHSHLDPTDTFSFDVGVDCHNFHPISSYDVARIMKEKYDSGIRAACQK